MRWRCLWLVTLFLWLGLCGVVHAQMDDPAFRARIRERVRIATEQKLVAALALDAATAAQMNALIDRYDEKIAAAQQGAHQAYRELKQYLDGSGSDAATIYRLAERILA